MSCDTHVTPPLQSIFLFEELEELDLSENDILFLPPSISKLRGLTSLNLSKNCACISNGFTRVYWEYLVNLLGITTSILEFTVGIPLQRCPASLMLLATAVTF